VRIERPAERGGDGFAEVTSRIQGKQTHQLWSGKGRPEAGKLARPQHALAVGQAAGITCKTQQSADPTRLSPWGRGDVSIVLGH
jgi:hypothetical protein